MGRLPICFLLLVGLSAHAAKPTEVLVVNPNTSPVPTLAIDPANGRFQASLDIDLFPGVLGNTSAFFAVPAGKVMVIEHISIHGFVPSGQKMIFDLQTFSGGASQHHWLESVDEGDGFTQLLPDGTSVTAEVFRSSESVRLYGDPGSNLFFNGTRNAAAGQGRATITVSGYLTSVVP
jgi:hypothetical protein